MFEDTIYLNLCPTCHSFIEILNENEKFIMFKCLNCDENKENKLAIEDYLKSLKNINKCFFCKIHKNSENWKFCVQCKTIICNDCINQHNDCNGTLMNFDEIGTKCLEHPNIKNNENIYYCKTCKKHICKECIKTKQHTSHIKADFVEILSEDEKNNIKKINESLKQLQKNTEKENENKIKELEINYENEKRQLEEEYEEKVDNNKKILDKEIKGAENKSEEIIANFIKKEKENLEQYINALKNKYKIDISEDEKKKEKQKQKLEKLFEREIKILKRNKLSKSNNINNLIKFNENINNNYEKNENNYFANKNLSNIVSSFAQKKDIIFENLKNYNEDYSEIELNNEIQENDFNISEILIEKDCLPIYSLDNSFEVYEEKGINIVYPYKNEIKCFNLNNKEMIKEIGSHNGGISGFRKYYNREEYKYLIMSISGNDNNLKVWDTDDWSCILDLKNVNDKGQLYSACFLKNNKNLYIVTSNAYKDEENEPIKIFDLKGNKIKQIESNKYIYSIDTFYDEDKSKDYIIAGCRGCIESYIFDEGIKYKTYENVNPNEKYIKSLYGENINTN